MIAQLKKDHDFWEFYSPDEAWAGYHRTYIWAGIIDRMLLDVDQAPLQGDFMASHAFILNSRFSILNFQLRCFSPSPPSSAPPRAVASAGGWFVAVALFFALLFRRPWLRPDPLGAGPDDRLRPPGRLFYHEVGRTGGAAKTAASRFIPSERFAGCLGSCTARREADSVVLLLPPGLSKGPSRAPGRRPRLEGPRHVPEQQSPIRSRSRMSSPLAKDRTGRISRPRPVDISEPPQPLGPLPPGLGPDRGRPSRQRVGDGILRLPSPPAPFRLVAIARRTGSANADERRFKTILPPGSVR